jgi:hypothetical protein
MEKVSSIAKTIKHENLSQYVSHFDTLKGRCRTSALIHLRRRKLSNASLYTLNHLGVNTHDFEISKNTCDGLFNMFKECTGVNGAKLFPRAEIQEEAKFSNH